MTEKYSFSGFDKNLFKFFKDLEKNNNVEWFQKNKSRYQEFLVVPARALVVELVPFLNRLNPAIRSEPKFNKTLMRINKDMRFAKGDPYKNYFLIHFGRFKMDSEFYIYLDANNVQIGLFLNNTAEPELYFKQNLKRYHNQILDVFEKYKLNSKYSLYTIKKEPEVILKKFDASKHLDKLTDINYILLQKATDPTWPKIYSSQLTVEIIKMISSLYPLYCFAITHDPMKELDKFEDDFGLMV
ncbi:DUF2461 family protein [Bacteroidota bacterium]